MGTWLDKAVDLIYKEERTIKSPQFIKDFSKENQQINNLNDLSKKLKNGVKKELILRDIAYLKKGLDGENNVYYELKNSFLPILCLHDIRLEHEGYIAQYDFIVISDRFICVLETKQLNGNIIVNPDGSFIRVIQDQKGKEIKREGMYSPITQNHRHLNILKKILLENKLMGNEWNYLSFVVIANPKSIVHKEKCPSEIDKMIIRHDQVIDSLKYHQHKSNYHKLEKYLFEIAYWLKQNNKPITYDYYVKYNLTDNDFLQGDEFKENYKNNVRECKTKDGKIYIKVTGTYEYAQKIRNEYINLGKNIGVLKRDRYNENEFIFFINENPSDSVAKTSEQIACTKDNSQNLYRKGREQLTEELKEFRLLKSREEKIAAYLIFNNEEMERLIAAYPKSDEELLKVKGFRAKKVEKYGADILKVFN